MDCVICGDSDDLRDDERDNELEDHVCFACEYEINKRIDARVNEGHLDEHIDWRIEACMKRARAEKTEKFWMAYIMGGCGPAALGSWFVAEPGIALLITVGSVPVAFLMVWMLDLGSGSGNNHHPHYDQGE